MALTKTRLELRAGIRRFADIGGNTARLRHPDSDLDDYINRALASLRRKMDESTPDLRYLQTSTETTVAGTTSYPLSGFTPSAASLYHLLTVELEANGRKSWLVAYEPHEHAMLTDPAQSFQGTPFVYRLEGSNIIVLPSPLAAHTITLTYVTDPTQLATDAATWDTIDRLDEYVYAYAARLIGTRDKNWDLVSAGKGLLDELDAAIVTLARNRDMNSPPRVVDEYLADRWGRRRYR